MDIKPKIKEEKIDREESIPNIFTVFAGTKSGILKGIQPAEDGELFVKNFPRSTELSKDNEITALNWRTSNKTELLIGHANKSVSVFDVGTSSYMYRKKIMFGRGKVVDIADRLGNVYVGLESGHVGVLFKEENGRFTNFDTLKGHRHNQRKYKPNLSCIKADPANNNKIATGGCENDLKIWDVNDTKKPIFAARNVAHDMLDLRVPIWVSDITYMQDNQTIAVVSRHKCVRLYDPRSKRRPVLNLKYEDSAITCVAAVPQRENFIVMGTAHGRVTMFDLRKKVPNRAPVVFKKIDGAIKDVACADDDPSTVYSVSLDRYFRVHDLNSKATVHKEYLKSKLTKVVV